MQELIKKHGTKFRFGLIGGLNTLLDFGLLFAFSSIYGRRTDVILGNNR